MYICRLKRTIYNIKFNISFMKQFHFIAGLAIFALATSCDDIKAPGIDKNIDTHSEVTVEEFTDLKGLSSLKTSPDGKYYIEQESASTLKASVNPGNGQTPINGTLTIHGSDLPSAAKPVEGAADNSGIIISVDNPSSHIIDFSATATIDGKNVLLPKTSVNPKDGKNLGYLTSADNSDKLDISVPVLIPETAKEPLANGIEQIDVYDVTVAPKMGATALAAASNVNLTLLAKYYTSLSFPAGTKLHITPTFSDLKIKLDRVNYPLKEYDIHMTLESTIPFDMQISVTSTDGVSGTCEDTVKAGAVGNPVKTDVTIHIVDNSGHNVSEISNATFSIDLIAGKNAYFGVGQYLKISTDKITIQKVN